MDEEKLNKAEELTEVTDKEELGQLDLNQEPKKSFDFKNKLSGLSKKKKIIAVIAVSYTHLTLPSTSFV